MSRAEQLAALPLGLCGEDFVIVEWTAEVGSHWIAPLHVHHADDEAWYVLEGHLGFRLGDEELSAGPGEAVLAPRGVPHTYRNAGHEQARYLLVLTPKIARLIDAIHTPGADLAAQFAAHDSELLPTV